MFSADNSLYDAEIIFLDGTTRHVSFQEFAEGKSGGLWLGRTDGSGGLWVNPSAVQTIATRPATDDD